MRTEFGRGYATCLYLFLGHTRRLRRDELLYRDMAAKYSNDQNLWTPEHAVEMWANGAADHLIDLVSPRRKVKRSDIAAAKDLADRMYRAGRPWYRHDDLISPDEARRGIKEAQRLLKSAATAADRRYPRSVDEAVLIDADLGLKADPRGYRSCFRSMKEDA